jgi:3-deoxy-D-manno-octulosonate 8-phosphate phosphatase (KDO 8-P phosphatase)
MTITATLSAQSWDPSVLDRASSIRLLCLDVDGVLTDARLYFDHEGREYKSFNARDGLGIRLLQKAGIEVAVISGRSSPVVEKRMQSLGIRWCFQGIENKASVLPSIEACSGIPREHIAHVGDDLIDLPLMRAVGMAIGVQDAHPSLSPFLHYRTRQKGGEGAVREVCDLLIVAHDKMDTIMESYL